jgi:hypothetical protein
MVVAPVLLFSEPMAVAPATELVQELVQEWFQARAPESPQDRAPWFARLVLVHRALLPEPGLPD